MGRGRRRLPGRQRARLRALSARARRRGQATALDGEHAGNGGLHVLPRTHGLGVLGTVRIRELAASIPGVVPDVPPRGATILSPLLVHGSRRARVGGPRRTVHLELAARELPGATRFRERVR